MSAAMTEDQRAMARRALGLGFHPKVSQKNYYDAQFGARSHDDWLAMVQAGFAIAEYTGAYATRFRLTRAGADLALDEGESLDPAHFPPIGAH